MVFYVYDFVKHTDANGNSRGSFDKIALIDDYVSMIWTDRYLKPGEFELYLRIGNKIPNSIKTGRYIVSSESEHVMVIEKIQIETDAEDENELIVTGRSVESLLDRRILFDKYEYPSGFRVHKVIQEIISDNITSATITLSNGKDDYRRMFLDQYNPYTETPSGEVDEIHHIFRYVKPTDSSVTDIILGVEYELQAGDNLLDVVCKLCEEYSLGFKVTLNEDTNMFEFRLYDGRDLSDPEKSNYVTFSANYGNLLSSNYSKDVTSYKNVAIIDGPEEDVYYLVETQGHEDLSPKEEGWYKYLDNEWIPTEDTEIDPQAVYYEKDNNDKRKVRAVKGTTRYLKRKEVYVDGSSCSRRGELTFDPLSWEEVSGKHPKEEGWYKDIDGDWVKTEDEDAVEGEQYYVKNTHTKDDEDFKETLREKGLEKLNECKKVEKFDGEIDYTNGVFKYGKNYRIGDIVYVANEYGYEGRARVTEYVFSDNVSDGAKFYPSFESIEEE